MTAADDTAPTGLLHLVPADDWTAEPDRPYAPASLESEGFVHCSPDVATTLAVATAFYSDAQRPLLVLHLDESRLRAPVVREAAVPAPRPGVGDEVLFPHVYGPLDRDAVLRVQQVVWSGSSAIGLEEPAPAMMVRTVRGMDGRDE